MLSRMYQMGPKSPSVNGAPPTGPGGKPPAVSDAQAREKLAVSLNRNRILSYHVIRIVIEK